MSLKLRRLLPFFVALFFASGQLPTLAQSVPCSAITRNPLVLEGLLDSHSNDEDMDVPEGTIHAAQLEHLQFTPIVIQPGDALYLEYRGRDFTISADFANGDRAAFDSSPRGSYEEWRRGILLLDLFRVGMKQRLVRLQTVGKEPGRVLLRNIRIIRAGRPVFEFSRLASYGKPQAKKTITRQLPCVAFDEAPAANPAVVNYVVPNGLAPKSLPGDYLRPMLPPLPMITMQSTAGTDGNHYKFTGKEFDDESGLYNYGARYYGPAIGRFTSPDPQGIALRHLLNPQKLNKYSYVLNNPESMFDPDGKEEVTIVYRTFIPSASVTVLGKTYGGDNRGFSTAPSASSRTSITVKIETDPHIRPGNPIISVESHAGQSTVMKNGKVVETATATKGLPTATGARDANGTPIINIQQDTKNPLSPGPQALTPGISANLNVMVYQDASTAQVSGTAAQFPASELNVTRAEGTTTPVIQYTPPSDATPWSLAKQDREVYEKKETPACSGSAQGCPK